MKTNVKTLITSFVLLAGISASAQSLPGLTRGGGGAAKEPKVAPALAISKPDPKAIAVPSGSSINEPMMDGRKVALLYQRFTGKRVVVGSSAEGVSFSFVQPGPLTNSEAAALLEMKILLEGMQFVTTNTMDVVKLLTEQAGASGTTPASEGLRVVSDEAGLLGNEEVVSYIMRLDFLKPEEALRTFQLIVKNFRPSGSIAAIPNASSLVITENTALIRQLVKIKEEIDVPSAQVATKFINVEYADVDGLATRLNELFNAQGNSNQSARVQRASRPGTPPLPNFGGNNSGGGAGEETPIQIEADSRTNRIFVMGRPNDIIFVQNLVDQWDVPTTTKNSLHRRLHYLPVDEFLPVAQNAIERTLGSSGEGSSSSSSGGAGGGGTPRSSSGSTGVTGQAGGGGGSAQIKDENVNTAPTSVTIGTTLLVADNLTNSIIVQGPPHHIEIVEDLLDDLDQPSEQIAITAVFGKYNLTDNKSFQIGLARALDSDNKLDGGGSFLSALTDSSDLNTLNGIGDLLSNGLGSGSISLYGLVGNEFGAVLNVLDRDENFKTLSRPTVFTTNNRTAKISSGQRISVRTNSYTGGTTGQSTNFEYQDVVLELEVKPLVNSADEVTLQIALVNDGIEGARDNTSEVPPDINSESLTTTVTIPNGHTIVLGGLIKEEVTQNEDKVPFLGEIPGIGKLFTSTVDEKLRNELVIMIRPEIVPNRKALKRYQDQYDQGTGVAPFARGSLNGGISLLPEFEEQVKRERQEFEEIEMARREAEEIARQNRALHNHSIVTQESKRKKRSHRRRGGRF